MARGGLWIGLMRMLLMVNSGALGGVVIVRSPPLYSRVGAMLVLMTRVDFARFVAIKRDDYIGLDLLRPLYGDPSSKVSLHIVADDHEIVLGTLSLEVSTDGYSWVSHLPVSKPRHSTENLDHVGPVSSHRGHPPASPVTPSNRRPPSPPHLFRTHPSFRLPPRRPGKRTRTSVDYRAG